MSTATLPAVKPIAVAAAAAILVAVLGASMTDLGPWYQQLAKPSWQPPDWLFGPAWTVIFSLTALSAVEGWQRTPPGTRNLLILMFAFNGLLNILWSVLFFRLQRPDLALMEVIALGLSIVCLLFILARVSRKATLLLVPYLCWIMFAGYLNYTVVILNQPF